MESQIALKLEKLREELTHTVTMRNDMQRRVQELTTHAVRLEGGIQALYDLLNPPAVLDRAEALASNGTTT